NQAIDKASRTLGMDPKDFQKTLRSWEGINNFMKFSMEQKFADNLGISYEKLAQYKNGFMELTVPREGLGNLGKEPGGLGDVSGLKADHREGGYEILKKQGYTPESFGGTQGHSEAAKIVGEMAHLKGGEPNSEEISRAHKADILSESGLNQAIAKAAKTLDMDGKDINNALSSWKGVSEFISLADTFKTGENAGMSAERLSQFKSDFAGAASNGGTRSLGELSAMTGDHRSIGYKNLQQHGLTGKDFGGREGYEQAAKIVGEMSAIKQEDLSPREISRFQKADMLTESGLNQVIDRATETVGINRKDMNRALGNWEGITKLADFAETQNKPVDLAAMDLANLSQSRQKFAEMVATAASTGKPGSDQGGRYGVAFTPDGKVELKTRRAGTDTKSGDFGAHGHETTSVDRITRDYQDVDKAGVLMSRGTAIDEKTAFEMARKGDPELVRMVTNPYLSDKEREAQIGVLSRTIGNAMSAFIDRKGVSHDYVRGSADLSVGVGGGIIFKASGEARGGVGGERMDRKTTDLRIQETDALIRDSLKTAREQKLGLTETREHLSNAIADKIEVVHLEARNNSPDKFGASAPGDLINKYIEKGQEGFSKSMLENPNYPGPR
ncbi:MAG: hypothetical protein HY730_00100, partial [Candidatus Tectomicrobia bacterium]|nr:hypothetical protein [Candidatus Tectomicrobia bacterium]